MKVLSREERFQRDIEWIVRRHKGEPVFQTDSMIYFNEIEDVIAWIAKNKPKRFKIPAWRYYCRENGRGGTKGLNRLYYMIEVSMTEDWTKDDWIKLVCQGCTDFSGHGRRDMELAEYFIGKVLGLRIEERPVSYLISQLVHELWKVKH